ncbi:unnamed protein product [Aphanomyces euteiches]
MEDTAPIRRRHQYSVMDKIVEILRVREGESQAAVSRALNVNPKTLQKWISHQSAIMAYRGSKKRKKIGNTGRPEIIPCVSSLVEHLTTLRDQELALSCSHMIQCLKYHANEWYLDYIEEKAGNKSAYKTLLRLLERFAHRHGFSRQRATMAKMTQEDLAALRAEFGAAFTSTSDLMLIPSTM